VKDKTNVHNDLIGGTTVLMSNMMVYNLFESPKEFERKIIECEEGNK
jgi:hypothetical protein